MIKTSTIKHIVGNGDWESQYGRMFSYILHFNNGDEAIFNTKTQDAFSVGQEISYQLTGQTDNNGTPRAKKVNPEYQNRQQQTYSKPSDDRQKSIECQMAIKAGVELAVAYNEPHKFPSYAQDVYKVLQDAKANW